jgi:hypothetical protein
VAVLQAEPTSAVLPVIASEHPFEPVAPRATRANARFDLRGASAGTAAAGG